MDPDDDDLYRLKKKQRRGVLYLSFLMCLIGGALVSTAIATQFWVTASPVNTLDPTYGGDFHAGLFKGESELITISHTYNDYISE